MQLTYGKHTIDFSALPETSQIALARRGLAHFLGNEQASKVAAYFDPDRKVPEDETRLPDNEENREVVKADFQAKAIDALLAGTVGVSTRGSGVDPLETEIERLAKAEIKALLADSGVKAPKKAADTVTIGGQAFTMEQLVARRLDPTGPAGKAKDGTIHLERLTKEAEKVLKAKAKAAADKAKAAREMGGAESL